MNFIPDVTSLMCNYNYLDLRSFVANGPCNYHRAPTSFGSTFNEIGMKIT